MTQRPAADLTYEQARDELVDVVGRLESGAASLEDSLALWERGEELADRCQSFIDDARTRLAAVQSRDDEHSTDAAEDPATNRTKEDK